MISPLPVMSVLTDSEAWHVRSPEPVTLADTVPHTRLPASKSPERLSLMSAESDFPKILISPEPESEAVTLVAAIP